MWIMQILPYYSFEPFFTERFLILIKMHTKCAECEEKKMKMFKTLLALVMALAMILSLTACGKIDASKDLENVKANGVLKVGMECGYEPFNWMQTDDSNGAVKIANADGYANGYDVQIAKKIADKLGVKLEVYQYEWDALIPAVEAGTLDCVIAGMSPTDERKETVDFSANYYVSNLVVITHKDGEIADAKSIADLKGRKIGAQDATFHATAADQIKDVKKSVLEDFTLLYTALTANTIDGYIAEEPTAYSICASNSDLTYIPLVNNESGFTCDEGDTAIAVAMRKGSSLNADVSAAINEISEDTRAQLMKDMVALTSDEK